MLEVVDGVDDLGFSVDLVPTSVDAILVAEEVAVMVGDEEVAEVGNMGVVPNVGEVLDSGEAVDGLELVGVLVGVELRLCEVGKPDFPLARQVVLLHPNVANLYIYILLLMG